MADNETKTRFCCDGTWWKFRSFKIQCRQVLKKKKICKFMKRVEVRVLIGVEVGDGGVCCGDSDDWDNYWGQSGGKTWGVKKKKWKNSNDVVMNKTDGLLIQSLRRLWVYHRGGELLQGCIHTERRNLRNTRGTGVLLGQLLSFSQESGY